jgi:phage shock protein PspC (stress-responsive transcriptional regulator)
MFGMMEFLNKFKSRKFLTCVAGVVTGICMIFGLDTSAVNTVAGAVTALGSIATYIYSEGKIDAAAVSGIKDAVETIIEIEE